MKNEIGNTHAHHDMQQDVAAVCMGTHRILNHVHLSIKLYLSSSRRKISHHVSSTEDPVRTFLLEWSQTALTCSGIFPNPITLLLLEELYPIRSRGTGSVLVDTDLQYIQLRKEQAGTRCFIYGLSHTYHLGLQRNESKPARAICRAIKHPCLYTMHFMKQDSVIHCADKNHTRLTE